MDRHGLAAGTVCLAGTDDLAAGARALRASTDRAILGLFGGNLLEMGQFYYRMDNFLAMLWPEIRSAPTASSTPSSKSTCGISKHSSARWATPST